MSPAKKPSERFFRLTPLEKRVLAKAADFVMVGEWPWDDRRENLERAALERAVAKLAIKDPYPKMVKALRKYVEYAESMGEETIHDIAADVLREIGEME